MKLKIKRNNVEAKIPTYGTPGSNGLDLYATTSVIRDDYVEVRTGLSMEIPEGYVGLLFPRSSISEKNLVMANSVGVIDSDYRGEVVMRFKVLEISSYGAFKYAKLFAQGDKIGQLLLVESPKIEIEEVKVLSETERGVKGLGSTGR